MLVEPLTKEVGSDNPHSPNERSETKKTIVVLAAYYLPGFKAGGPVRSIVGLVERLKDHYNFKIVCGDRDLGDEKPFPNEPAKLWYAYGAARVLRIPSSPVGTLIMLGALRSESYDILYLNSVWSRIYSMLPLVCRRLGLLPKAKVVLAPRGELSIEALGLKPRRKRIYLTLARMTRLFDGVFWQASSQSEMREILLTVGRVKVEKAASISAMENRSCDHLDRMAKIIVASDLGCIRGAPSSKRLSKARGELRVVTLGRVCRMKNIEYAIRLFRGFSGHAQFDIYGPLEDKEYVKKCKEQSARLPQSVQVRFMGEIPHELVLSILSQYHVFLLPTLGENYGHVIPEAMQAGCVPLISDRTPWRGLQDSNAGWDLSLSNPEMFTAALRAALTWSDEEFQHQSDNVQSFVTNHPLIQLAIEENLQLFRSVLAQST